MPGQRQRASVLGRRPADHPSPGAERTTREEVIAEGDRTSRNASRATIFLSDGTKREAYAVVPEKEEDWT